jgi:uncharacterized protein (TIGR02231 family)
MKSRLNIAALVLITCFFGINLLQAAAKVEAPITRVTVYPDRAMVTRSVLLELPSGDQTVVIEEIPNHARDESFRSSITGDLALLLGLNHRSIRHTEIPQQKAAELDKKIYTLENYERQGIIDRQEVFSQQKKMLLAIGFKSGEEMSEELEKGGLEIAQWQTAYEFLGNGLRAINDSLSNVKRELDEADKQLSKLKADRQTFIAQFSQHSKTVEIDVRLAKAGSVNIELDYIIDGAWWKPIYDARLNEETQKVDLYCYGEVAQRTGEDWDNVDLVLSTAQPSQGAGPGDLIPWILSLYEPIGRVTEVRGTRKSIDFLATGTQTIKTQQEIIVPPVATVDDLLARETGIGYFDMYQIVASAYNTVFNVTRKVSIASSDEAVRAPIGNYTLDRKFEHLCRPQNRLGVYRLATITNQNEAPLLPGRVAIFAGSDYLGNTHLNRFVAPGDEFDLPFGQDDNFEVKREMTENKTSPKGDKTRVEQTIKITLANNSQSSRTISVEERLPVLQDGRIKVKMRDVKPQRDETDDEENDKAVWTINLTPGQEMTITMPYRIEYPAGTQLAGM